MPITQKLTQPFGLLHGGVSVALAESLASVATIINVDQEKSSILGVDINATHMSPGFVGDTVIGTARPLQIGRTQHVWSMELRSEKTGKLICVSRCTVAVVDRSKVLATLNANSKGGITDKVKGPRFLEAAQKEPESAASEEARRDREFHALQAAITPSAQTDHLLLSRL